MLLLTILVTLTSLVTSDNKPSRPNILYILADDVGFGDVSWNNPRMVTPILHQLASQAGALLKCKQSTELSLFGHFYFEYVFLNS